jgi:predicted nucleotidyltransferase
MPPELPPLVLRTLQRLIVTFAPERVILFGSYAKGTVRSRSDVDLLVVADLHGNRELHRRHARQLAGDCFPRVDVVLATPLEVAEAGGAKSPFLQSILGSGIEIYVTNPAAASWMTSSRNIPEPISDGRAIALIDNLNRFPA